jgi:polyhydroxybutyrate depolymerase
MKKIILSAWALGFYFIAASSHAGLLTKDSFNYGGKAREYWLYTPEGQGPWPLVMALHGGGGRAKGMEHLTGLCALGAKEGFAVCYPESVGTNWNDGRKDFKASGEDDAGFLNALGKTLVDQKIAKAGALDVCGISNGGMMSLRLACENSGLFSAAGIVAASQPATYECKPSPLPLCFVFGRQDPLIPYGGGSIRLFRGGRSRGKVLPLEETLALWAWVDSCGKPAVIDMPDTDPKDGTRVKHRVYPGCKADLELYLVEGGGHAWPGGWAYMGAWAIGRTSRDFNASQALWDFFKKHNH